MLDLCFRNQIETARQDLVYCLLQLSVVTSVLIVNMTKFHNWISWFDWINLILWFELISSILWLDSISFILWFDLIILMYLLNLITLTQLLFPSPPRGNLWNNIPITFLKYHWLGPDLTQNTRGEYIPIFPIVLIVLTLDGPARRFIPNLI